MLRKDHCLPVIAKFVSFCYTIYDKQLELDKCYERHILHVNMTPLKIEDRLLIKTSQKEKGWIVEKSLLSFQQDKKWHMLLDLLRIIGSTG